jgi:hypothetical protein
LWGRIRAGETVSLEDEALALAELDHPEFAVLWDLEDDLPDQFQVAGTDPGVHVQMHQVIETQLLEDNPTGVRPAMAHLLELGVDRHAAVHLIMEGLLKDQDNGLRHGAASNYHGFVDRLRLARVGGGGASLKAGRNDPCPCGSGKKFKRCCGDAASGPIVDPRAVGMTLGTGFYAGPVTLNWPPSHKLVALENHLAVAQALERRQVATVARAAYQRLVDFAESEGEKCLNNALQDQMEFAMNHPEYTEDGISAATRLRALPSNRAQLDMVSVDLAEPPRTRRTVRGPVKEKETLSQKTVN